MTDEERYSRAYAEALHQQIMQEQQLRPLFAIEKLNLRVLEVLIVILEGCE